MRRYNVEFSIEEVQWQVLCHGRLVFSCDLRAQAETLCDELNEACGDVKHDTVTRIAADAASLRMRLLCITTSTDSDPIHEAQQYLFIAHALLQQVECNLNLGDYAMRRAVQA